jgi:hypothetical protein
MSEQIYKHLPHWRRIIHDLAAEAGIKKFLNTSDTHDEKSSSDLGPSDPENENDRATDPSQTRRPKRAEV